ncbi:hypothetical protein TNCV_2759151 [Trichonephila clavipes]|nr:hypothetical protein TNCV_2759151 [Trichonephila clavipes]
MCVEAETEYLLCSLTHPQPLNGIQICDISVIILLKTTRSSNSREEIYPTSLQPLPLSLLRGWNHAVNIKSFCRCSSDEHTSVVHLFPQRRGRRGHQDARVDVSYSQTTSEATHELK